MKVRLWKVFTGILLIALLVGAGAMLYRAGYSHGVMSDFPVEALPNAEGGSAYMHPYYGMRGYPGHFGFFFLGRFFFGMLFFFLFFGLIFRFFGMRHYWKMRYADEGGPPWMRHHKRHRGPWGDEEPQEDGKDTKSEDTEE